MKPSRISRLSTFPTASRFFHFLAIEELVAHATSPPGREEKHSVPHINSSLKVQLREMK
jgi:hypothetical protein